MSRLRIAVVAVLIGAVLAVFVRPAWTQEGSSALSPLSAARATFRKQDAGLVREVRLALVCYGGSSLAIYIHGNTKEILRLVQASKALQQDSLVNQGAMREEVAADRRPEPGEYGRKLTGSARKWYDLLLEKWVNDPQKVRTRVVVDVIAGTSAGGINGVILAKALAHDLQVDDLTRLWLDKASLAKLTNGYFGLFRVLVGRPPVDGNALVGWLFDALNSMDAEDRENFDAGSTPSLLPGGDRLDLFVTATDRFGYPQNLVVGDPASAVEKRYRHVLHFVYPGVYEGCGPKAPRPPGAEIDHFCPEWTPALAFAARASSSIPGVFPPLNIEDTMKTIAKAAAVGPSPGNQVTPATLDQVVHSLFRNYELQEPDGKGTYATNTYFVDGGVLDNHPFGPAIEAILSRPQEQEVRRFLVYLQPDPGKPPTGPVKVDNPGLLQTIWAGLSGIPSGQPILDNLNEIVAHNDELDRIRDIVQAEEQAARDVESAKSSLGCDDLDALPVAQRFGCVMGYAPGHLGEALAKAEQSDLQEVRRKLEVAAVRGFVEKQGTEKSAADALDTLNPTGRSYINLRVHSVLDQLVRVIAGQGGCNYPEESAQRLLIARIVKRWAAGQKLIGLQDSPAEQRAQLESQWRFLRNFDVGYQRRQLRFVIDWINEQYTPDLLREKREHLDKLKHAAAARVEELSQLVAGTVPELNQELQQLGSVFCRLRPWELKDGQTVALDQQAEIFLADPKNQAALQAARDKVGEVLSRRQQQVRDESFKNFKELTSPLTSQLTVEEQKEVLIRYLGFPFWDRQIYPYVAFSQVAEFRDIDVYRLSPDDATLLGRRTALDKLVGAKKAHFGAFLSREGRESDYLWGRLDAGERLLALLGSGRGGAKELFNTIVQEETAAGLVRPSILDERQAEIDGLQ